MSKQSWESWRGFEEGESTPEQPTVPYQHVANDPVQRRAVETALLSGADVDPKIVQAMGIGVGRTTVVVKDVSGVGQVPRVPYGGTESVQDVPAVVVVPDDARANLPA